MNWLSALVKPFFQVAAEALRDWRRDRQLKKLGYSNAQRQMAKKAHKVRTVWRDIDRVDTERRLRSGQY